MVKRNIILFVETLWTHLIKKLLVTRLTLLKIIKWKYKNCWVFKIWLVALLKAFLAKNLRFSRLGITELLLWIVTWKKYSHVLQTL